MNYTLHQLHIFLKVTQTRSITKAAAELYLTQPAVSLQLKKFQEHFEVRLYEIIGQRIHITDFGQEIAEAAENIIHQAQAIYYKTQAYQGLLTGKLKISVVSTGKYVMPYFLSGFMQRHEGVELAMEVTNRAHVLKSLENNLIDFALVSILPEYLQIDHRELMRNKLYLVGKAENKFTNIDTSILKNLSLIYREEGSGTRVVMENFVKNHRIDIRKKIELTSNEAVKQAVIAGLGYSIMPLIGIKNELYQNELQIINVPGLPITTHWHLVWLKNKSFSPLAHAYLKYISHEKEKIVARYFSWLENYS